MSEYDTTSKNEVPFMAVARNDLDVAQTLEEISIHGFVNVVTINERDDGSISFTGWILRDGPVESAVTGTDLSVEK